MLNLIYARGFIQFLFYQYLLLFCMSTAEQLLFLDYIKKFYCRYLKQKIRDAKEQKKEVLKVIFILSSGKLLKQKN